MYTSLSYSTPVLTERYDLLFRNDRVQYHTDRFLRLFYISDEPRERILLEDDLRATYLKFYNDGAVQVEVVMEDTYQYHANLLAGTLEAQAAIRLRGGHGTADNK